ncbi:protein FAM210A-like [Ylistrum balloti]|uniref:protein FAM210A-like n=1 Tax=Ylistrum balloti TaxID=509963 RepID=UPI002905F2B7|nr:protein FAM210A-like [Ylistrum balloti]
MQFPSSMLNSTRACVHRSVQHFCQHPISISSTRRALEKSVRARPWILTYRKKPTQDKCVQRYMKTVHEGTSPVLVNRLQCPSNWLNKQTFMYQRCFPLFGSRCDFNYVQINRYHSHINYRHFSVQLRQKQKSTEEIKTTPEEGENNLKEPEEKLTLVQRFKKTYKEHGKVLIGVHLVTSCVWFGTFYGIVDSGVDIVALLEKLGCSETIINPFKSSSMGNVALAYLMYKLATPARYTVTIGGTNMVIKYMRKTARLPPLKKEDQLRSMFKQEVKDRSTKLKRRAIARAKRTKRINEGRRVIAVGRDFITKCKSKSDRIRLKWKSFRLNKKNSKRKNGSSSRN